MVEAAAIYCRISRDPDGNLLGVARQREDCEALAQHKGWKVAEVYVDDDVSAWSGRTRPAYERMLADLEAGRRDALVVYHLDRLYRQPRELEHLIDLANHRQIALATCTGDIDLATAEGRMLARIMGAVAAAESDAKSRRLKRQRAQLATTGRPHGGGRRPYGYERDGMTVRPAEAEVILEAADRFLAGESLPSIAADLNARGVRAASGGSWRTSSLRDILAGPRIAGLRVHQGEIVGEAAWPAIISRETHERIRAVLGDPRRRQRGRPASRLLSGLVVCGKCGQRMAANAPRPVNGAMQSARYSCWTGPGHDGCGRRAIAAVPLEDLVTGAVLDALSAPEVAAVVTGRPQPLAGPDTAALTAQLTADQQRLDELAVSFADGLIDRGQLLAGTERIRTRMESVRRRLRSHERTALLDGLPTDRAGLVSLWDSRPVEWRRQIVAAVLEVVEIGPGRKGPRRMDPGRVNLRWLRTP